jgi:hypothetical protein
MRLNRLLVQEILDTEQRLFFLVPQIQNVQAIAIRIDRGMKPRDIARRVCGINAL